MGAVGHASIASRIGSRVVCAVMQAPQWKRGCNTREHGHGGSKACGWHKEKRAWRLSSTCAQQNEGAAGEGSSTKRHKEFHEISNRSSNAWDQQQSSLGC
eukprot:1154183-Pelagomonas_calceolata.AAC.6